MANVVKEKLFAFAVRIVNLYKFLCGEKKEFVISNQLLRSAASSILHPLFSVRSVAPW